MSLLWPRLTQATAVSVFSLLKESSESGAWPEPAFEHPAQIYAATGGTRASTGDLQGCRTVVEQLAKKHGFPTGLNGDAIRFDRSLAAVVVDIMDVTPAEATQRGVWSFMALILLPDITYWRFGTGNQERWVASDLTRHTFGRLWWQAHLLSVRRTGYWDMSLLNGLLESDLNQLLERTRLGGTRPLVRSLARAILAADVTLPRRELVREAAMRLRRRMAFVDFMALSEAEIEAEVEEVMVSVLREIART